MRYHVEILFSFNINIKHLSHILLGLFLLERDNTITLEWKRLPIIETEVNTISINATDSYSGRQCVIVFDMHDASDRFDYEGLNNCDYYFKRSFYAKDISGLSPEQQKKIKIYGMNLPMTEFEFRQKIFGQVMLQIGGNLLSSPIKVTRMAKDYFNTYHQFFGLATQKIYSQLPGSPVPDSIFFQTRLWEQEYVGGDSSNEINMRRVELVRALKKNFRDKFVGGILPTDYGKKLCPDCLTAMPTKAKNYIQVLKSNLIGVYTRGLNHSLALKMPEYIAASLCIVTESIRNQVAGSFAKNVNYLEFSDIDSCLAQCERLLVDKEYARAMRHENYNYYVENLDPANKAMNCLNDAFAS